MSGVVLIATSGAQRFDLMGVLLPVGLMIAALIVLSVVLLALRRRMLAARRDESGFGLFEEIRRLHDSGELTDEEFEQARRKMIAKAKGGSD